MRFVLKNKNFWISFYIVLLIFSFIYIRWVLGSTQVQVLDKPLEEKVARVQPAKVTLNVYLNEASGPITYLARLQNTYTVLDLLNSLKSSSDLTYEKLLYTFGTELTMVNNVPAPTGYKWKVFFNGQDITNTINKLYLKDSAHYDLRLIRI